MIKKITILALGMMFVSFFVVLNGYTVSVLWEWFIIPVFMVDALNIPQATGIALIISYLTSGTPAKEDDKYKTVGIVIAKPLLALLIGYIVTFFL